MKLSIVVKHDYFDMFMNFLKKENIEVLRLAAYGDDYYFQVFASEQQRRDCDKFIAKEIKGSDPLHCRMWDNQ